MKLPTYVDTDSLVFQTKKKSTYRQTIKIINPLDQPIVYKVECTNPKLFTVRPVKGKLKPCSSLQIQVQYNHNHETVLPEYSRLRVSTANVENDMEGTWLIKVAFDTKNPVEESPASNTNTNVATVNNLELPPTKTEDDLQLAFNNPTTVIFISSMFFICLCVVLAPNEHSSSDSTIFQYIPNPTVAHQLAASFLLGMIVMAVLSAHQQTS